VPGTTDTKRRLSFVAILAVMGPGIIAASAGNDAGGISTYSVAGADFGYEMLWMLPIMTLSLVVVQEMALRMGAVTGKGFAALIRERFGIRPSLFAMLALVISTAATSVSEFAGIASAMEILGVSRYVAVPIAALAVWLLVVRGSYRRVEKILLGLSAVFIAYIVSAFLVGPDWAEVARATVLPSIELSSDFIVLSIAMVGTTIAPWMQFFVQANVVDKGISARDLPLQRIDVISGTIAAGFIAWCIVLTTGTVLHGSGAGISTAADAAGALVPVAGPYAAQLFALGLLGASLLAACVLPLTASYAVCEAFGFERGIDRSWSEAPVFNAIYTFVIVFGAAFILIPGLDLVAIMVFSQVIGGILLPFLLFYMMIIVNDRRIMGRHANNRVANVLGWSTIILTTALTVGLIVITVLGIG